MDEAPSEGIAPSPSLPAWLVHAFTASGTVLALLAVAAIERGQWRLALLWLMAALVVDGIDGTLARRLRVAARLPRIDGSVLDLLVDYLTYVFVPALFIWRAGLLPEASALALTALIPLSALYTFARTDMKTQDGYFRGFPALWNVAAFYLFIVQPGPAAGAATVVLLAALTFAPIHFIHPFRTSDWGRWPPALAILWASPTAALLWPGWSHGVATVLLVASLTAAAILVALGLARSIRGRGPG